MRVVSIREPFLGKRNLAHGGFSLYWPAEAHDRRDNRVLITVREALLKKTIVESRTDLVSCPYCMVLDITEGEIHAKGRERKIRIVNVYDNKLGEGQTWRRAGANDKSGNSRHSVAIYHKTASADCGRYECTQSNGRIILATM